MLKIQSLPYRNGDLQGSIEILQNWNGEYEFLAVTHGDFKSCESMGLAKKWMGERGYSEK